MHSETYNVVYHITSHIDPGTQGIATQKYKEQYRKVTEL